MEVQSSESPLRVVISDDEKQDLSLPEFIEKWNTQELYINHLEGKLQIDGNTIEDKLKLQQQEATRRENVLVMRLATKEQEMQELLGQIQELKQTQAPSTSQLQSMLIDPAVNLLFEKMKTELTETKDRLDQAQNDLSAWKFTPDSVTGKKLMAKCRMLIQENQDLGKQLSQGRIAQLESELALQTKYSEELKGSQDEMNEFVIQLDEEVEGMQATICALQEQLKVEKNTSENLLKENGRLKNTVEQSSKVTNHVLNGTRSQEMNIQHVSIKEEREPTHVRLPYSDVKEEFHDERTMRPPSNGDSNMSNASDELPMDTEPSITLPRQQQNHRTDEFQGSLDTSHHIPNHVTVIRGTVDEKKDLESPIHTFVSPTRGVPKTSFSINDLLAVESMKKDNDVPMETAIPLKTEENGVNVHHSSLNGDIDDNVI